MPASLSAHPSLSIPAFGAFQRQLTPFNSTPREGRGHGRRRSDIPRGLAQDEVQARGGVRARRKVMRRRAIRVRRRERRERRRLTAVRRRETSSFLVRHYFCMTLLRDRRFRATRRDATLCERRRARARASNLQIRRHRALHVPKLQHRLLEVAVLPHPPFARARHPPRPLRVQSARVRLRG